MLRGICREWCWKTRKAHAGRARGGIWNATGYYHVRLFLLSYHTQISLPPSTLAALHESRNFPSPISHLESPPPSICTTRSAECAPRLTSFCMFLDCRGCTENGRRCSGYGVRLQWPNELAKRRTQQDPSRKRPNSRIASKAAADSVGGSLLVRNKRGSEAGQPRLLSTLGLPEGESYLMQHYLSASKMNSYGTVLVLVPRLDIPDIWIFMLMSTRKYIQSGSRSRLQREWLPLATQHGNARAVSAERHPRRLGISSQPLAEDD